MTSKSVTCIRTRHRRPTGVPDATTRYARAKATKSSCRATRPTCAGTGTRRVGAPPRRDTRPVDHGRFARSHTNGQNAASTTSTVGDSPAGVTDATSNRTSPCRSGCSASHFAASVRKRRCFVAVTASAGEPKRSLLRVFTSQNTIVRPRRATRSISPSRTRQLRSTISKPRAAYQRAAASSPNVPSVRRASEMRVSAGVRALCRRVPRC
jgi:hypothetical protein